MIGITLSPEQVRAAPPEVRRWLRREIAAAFEFPVDGEAAKTAPEHLVVCGPEEVAAIYATIRNVLPVVNVFFELGREGDGVGAKGVEAYRLDEMARHARLQSVEQLDECLQVIDAAVRAIRNDPGATLYVLDPRGYCLIATATHANILALWRQLVVGQGVKDAPRPAAPAAGAPPAEAQGFPEVSATIPVRGPDPE
jgi:hypothetical protein